MSIIPISMAQTNNTISVGNVAIGSGENVTLPITITNATGVAVVGIKLSYSNILVNVTGATIGSFVQNPLMDFFAFNGRKSANGWVTINTYITGTNLTGNVTIANITLKVIGSSGESPLDIAILAMADQYASPINGTTQNGSIKITSVSPNTPTTPSSSGGGGGGGGGGTSGENYSNIQLKEKYDLHIFKDKTTRYFFTNKSNPVMFINLTGNVNAGETGVVIEVLKNTSTLVRTKAPGKVYKNMNIWVGTSGFAVSRNIKEAVIKFRVESSWPVQNNMENSDMMMVRWDGSTWIPLEIKELDKDKEFIYFVAKTYAFSPFAITGLKGTTETPPITQVQMTEIVTSTPVVTETPPPEKAPLVNLNIIIGMLLIIAAIVVLYSRRSR